MLELGERHLKQDLWCGMLGAGFALATGRYILGLCVAGGLALGCSLLESFQRRRVGRHNKKENPTKTEP